MTDKLRQSLVIFSLTGVIVINALANILPIAGKTTGELSDSYPILFVPAGYVFSIWGVIYLGLIAYVSFQALGSQMKNERLSAIAPLFILNALGNMAWIFAWHYEQLWLSLALMLVILLTLIMIYQKLRIGETKVSKAETLCTRVPFSIYLAWITVATVANASVVLYNAGWAGLGLSETFWAVALLSVATAIGLTMVTQRKDSAFGLVLVWAFVGIVLKHWTVPSFALSALVAASIIALAIFINLVRPREAKLQLATP